MWGLGPQFCHPMHPSITIEHTCRRERLRRLPPPSETTISRRSAGPTAPRPLRQELEYYTETDLAPAPEST